MPIGTTGVTFGGGYNTFYHFKDNNNNNWVRLSSATPSFFQIAASPQDSAVSSCSYCFLNGLIYEYGGFNGGALSQSNSLYSYNPMSNSWTTLAPSPSVIGTSSGGLLPCNNKIYAVTGYNNNGAGSFYSSSSSNQVFEYTPSTNTWVTKNNAPDSITAGCCVYNGVIYRVCGYDGVSPSNSCYAYYPTSDTWVQLANHPNANGLTGLQPVAHAGKIWCPGGSDGNSGAAVNNFFVYDIASNVWSSFAPLLAPLTAYQAELFEGRLYLVSGITTSSNISQAIYYYQFENGTWTKDTLATPNFILQGGLNQGVVAQEPVGLGGG
jgi:N-acetylneuraminic acid mutarotase